MSSAAESTSPLPPEPSQAAPSSPSHRPAIAADEVAQVALAEVQYLCMQRYGAVRSPDLSHAALPDFEHRLVACLDAILARGPQTVDWLLAALTTAESRDEVCGIAVALLESRTPAAATGLLASLAATPDEAKLLGFQTAFRRGPIDPLTPTFQEWLQSGTAHQAVAAAEALAYHQQLNKAPPRLMQLINEPDPPIRRAAWRALAYVEGK